MNAEQVVRQEFERILSTNNHTAIDLEKDSKGKYVFWFTNSLWSWFKLGAQFQRISMRKLPVIEGGDLKLESKQ